MTANKKLNKLKKHIISKFVGIEHLDIKFQKLNFFIYDYDISIEYRYDDVYHVLIYKISYFKDYGNYQGSLMKAKMCHKLFEIYDTMNEVLLKDERYKGLLRKYKLKRILE
jgi:hypothetical protein